MPYLFLGRPKNGLQLSREKFHDHALTIEGQEYDEAHMCTMSPSPIFIGWIQF